MKKIAIVRTIISDAAKRNAVAKKHIEAGEPCVGIFWVLPGDQVVGDITPVSEAENYGGVLNGKNDHYQFWSTLQRAYKGMPDIADHEYDYWPRGRVMKNSETGEFYVLADKQVAWNSIRLRKVTREFSVPFRNAVVNTDDHYRAKGDLGGQLSAPAKQDVIIQSYVDGEEHVKRNFPNMASAVEFLKTHYGAFSPEQIKSLEAGKQTKVDVDEYVVMSAA